MRYLLIVGYSLVGLWFTGTVVFAFHSFSTPISTPEVQILSPSPAPPVPIDSLMISQAAHLLRDPFMPGTIKPVVVVTKADVLDPSGVRVKAIIHSLKSGVILEDTRSGSVYFLSEGECVGGILVKVISKSNVKIEIDGKQIDLKLSGGP